MSPVPSPTARYTVVAVGGASGALLRAGVTELVPTGDGPFPVGMLLTQTVGCALAGLLTPWLLHRGPLWSLSFLTGALASFTTFGLFAGEVLVLAPEHLVSAVVYLLAATLLGVGAAVVGLSVAMGEVPQLSALAVRERRRPHRTDVPLTPAQQDDQEDTAARTGHRGPIRSQATPHDRSRRRGWWRR